MRRRRRPQPWGATGALALVVLALVGGARAEDSSALVVSPPGRTVEMQAGERRGFSALLAGSDVQYAWALDGAASGQGPRFEYRPSVGHVGRHEVSVTALAGPTAVRHTWVVTVEAAGPPKIVRAAPAAAVLRLPAGELLQFELQAEPTALTDQVSVRWTVDGAPMGEGSFLTLRVPAAGTQRVRAVATSRDGGAVVREWQIVATAGPSPEAPPEAAPVALAPAARPDPPPAPEPSPQKAPSPASPGPKKPEPAVAPKPEKPARPLRTPPPTAAPAKKPLPPAEPPRALARLAPTTTLPPPTPPPVPAAPPPAPADVTEDDVRALMFRYEQAWRTRNVGELRRIGHVESDEQEGALAKYFATTNDLEVAVHVIELRVDGGQGTVRFTRRDRFRDPAGREVTKESPPIEKTVVRTPSGVRFSPRS
jgi:hypothetical protein